MGNLLAIDIGSKIIGLAIGNSEVKMSFPRTPLLTSDKQWFKKLENLIREENVERIVVGFPLTLSGEAGSSARRVERFVNSLKKVTNLPIELVDESYSTDEAKSLMPHGKDLKKSGRLDSAAAVIILNRYFEGLTET